MVYSIGLEDPVKPEIMRLLQDGEAYGAALYPAESNHYLPIDALRGPEVRFVVARDVSGAAIGTGAIVFADGWAELKRMWVVPEARGRGLSKALLADLEERAWSARIGTVRLETGISNREALGLYARSGYVVRGPFGDYAEDPLSVFMEKQLG